jgi:hypothetical protein
LLGFFFLVEEVPDAEEEVACSGRRAMAVAVTAAGVDVADTLIASARSSDAVIGTLVIFLRCSSLPGADPFG